MKEKNKKFMKALGVGAVAALGLFTFTGCSLSDSEKAKLMNELDNATEYMEETIDQLKEQNKKLKEQNEILKQQNETAKGGLEESKTTNSTLLEQLEELKKQVKALEDGLLAEQEENEILGDSLTESEKTNTTLSQYLEELKKQVKALEDSLSAEQAENDILQDYLEEIQNENAKITAEEAYNKLLQAQYNLITNKDGIRDNLRLIYEEDKDELTAEINFYQTENNGYVFYDDYQSGEDYHVSEIFYEENEDVYYYRKDVNNVEDYKKEIREEYNNSEAAAHILFYFKEFITFDKTVISPTDITSVEILENGNYKICVTYLETEDGEYFGQYHCVIEYEISREGQFIGVFNKMFEFKSSQDSTVSSYTSKKVKFEYGVIEEDYINEMLQEAISKDLKD